MMVRDGVVLVVARDAEVAHGNGNEAEVKMGVGTEKIGTLPHKDANLLRRQDYVYITRS